MMNGQRWLSLVGALVFGVMSTGCGDIGRLVLNLEFPDTQTELRTRALEVVVRSVPGGGVCRNVFLARPPQSLERRSLIEYPNEVDIRASNVDISIYDPLSILVYAFSTTDIEVSNPIAGGCVEENFEAERTSELTLDLMRAP